MIIITIIIIIIIIMRDMRETAFLFHRLSSTIQWLNAISSSMAVNIAYTDS